MDVSSILYFLKSIPRQPPQNSVSVVDRNFPVLLRSRLEATSNGLEKKTTLIAKDMSGGQDLLFEEACQDSYPQTSHWMELSTSTAGLVSSLGKDSTILQKFGIDTLLSPTVGQANRFRDSGLQYARVKRITEILGAANCYLREWHGNSSQRAVESHLASCAADSYCADRVIRTNFGETFSTLRYSNGVPARVDSISALWHYLRALRARRPATLREFASVAYSYALSTGPSSNVRWLQRIGQKLFTEVSTYWKNSATDGRDEFSKDTLRPFATAQRSETLTSEARVNCNGDGASMTYRYNRAADNSDLVESFVLTSDTNSLNGQLQIGRCQILLGQSNVLEQDHGRTPSKTLE